MRFKVSPESRSIPLFVKLVFSTFLAWHLYLNLRFYGPINYLWFCDIALLTTGIGLWTESRLLLAMSAISLFGPSTLWMIDFFHKIITHRDLMGMTDYMQDPQLPLPLRVASTFHLWLPILLLGCIHRLGYDQRALRCQTVFAVVVLLLSRTLGAPPPAHDIHEVVNINCAYGTSDAAPQTKLPAVLYLAKVVVKCWVGMYLPTHLLLRWFFRRHQSRSVKAAAGWQSSTDPPGRFQEVPAHG